MATSMCLSPDPTVAVTNVATFLLHPSSSSYKCKSMYYQPEPLPYYHCPLHSCAPRYRWCVRCALMGRDPRSPRRAASCYMTSTYRAQHGTPITTVWLQLTGTCTGVGSMYHFAFLTCMNVNFQGSRSPFKGPKISRL